VFCKITPCHSVIRRWQHCYIEMRVSVFDALFTERKVPFKPHFLEGLNFQPGLLCPAMLIILILCTLRDTVTAVFLCLCTSSPNNIIGCHNVAHVTKCWRKHVAIHITTKFNSITWGGIFFCAFGWLWMCVCMYICMYLLYEKLYSLYSVYICIFLVWMLFWIHFLSCIPRNVPWVAFKPCKSPLVAWEWSPVLTVQMGLQVTGNEQKRECIYIYTLYLCFDYFVHIPYLCLHIFTVAFWIMIACYSREVSYHH